MHNRIHSIDERFLRRNSISLLDAYPRWRNRRPCEISSRSRFAQPWHFLKLDSTPIVEEKSLASGSRWKSSKDRCGVLYCVQPWKFKSWSISIHYRDCAMAFRNAPEIAVDISLHGRPIAEGLALTLVESSWSVTTVDQKYVHVLFLRYPR